MDVCGQVTGPERCLPPVVDVDAVRCGQWRLVPVERGVTTRDGRPRARVGSRFAGDVSGIELGEGGVEVIEVEHEDAAYSVVGVDLDDTEGAPSLNASGCSS